MKKLLLLFLVLSALDLSAQNTTPLEWKGHYEGLITVHESNGKRDTMIMHLNVLELNDSAMRWEIKYIDRRGRQDNRRYVLRTINKEEGYYIIDELTGIKIDAMRSKTTLVCRFSVENNLFEIIYNFAPEGCAYEVYTSSITPQTTGGGAVPEVNSYKVTIQQKAFLRRIP